MLVLQPPQRKLLAETVRDIANITAGAMVFGQFLNDRTFSPAVAVAGMLLWLGLVGWAILLANEATS
jgi:hypothetical protein